MSNALGLEKNSKISSASDRSFGIMFGFIFLILAGLLRLRNEPENIQIVLVVLSFLVFLVSIVRPVLLKAPNRLWMKFSLFLARFISPIVLGVLFFVLISPLALALRIFGRDELHLKSKEVHTNWRSRNIIGYSLESFKNQY